MGVRDAGRRQPEARKTRDTGPGHTAFLAAPRHRATPAPDDLVAEVLERGEVQGHAVVVDVPLNHRAQPLPHLRDGTMQPASQLGFHLAELAPHSFSGRQPQQLKLPIRGFPTDVCEAQEVEGLRLAPSAPPSPPAPPPPDAQTPRLS